MKEILSCVNELKQQYSNNANIKWMWNEIADFIDLHSDFFGVWFITGKYN